MIENDIVIPSSSGVPSIYCIKLVLANKMYFAQSNFMDKSAVNWLPVNIKNNDNPIAKELFRKTDEIMKAIVDSIIISIEPNP